MKILIAPSILAADFGQLNAEIASIEKHVDLFHVDIMDGHFVPNITFGPPAVSRITTALPLDCHLMIEHPDQYIEAFAKAIAAHPRQLKKCFIVVHREVFRDAKSAQKTLRKIKSFGVASGIAINPETPVSKLDGITADMVLVMSVHPGFGGQSFIADVLPKIKKLRKKFPKLDIEIDGGINEKTAALAIEAGANILVAGSYIFAAKNRVAAIRNLRSK